MAKTFTSEKIWSSNGDERCMYVTCEQVTNGSAANTSTIKWVLHVEGGSSTSYTTGPTTLTIAGKQVYYKAQTVWSAHVFPAKAGTTSGSFTLNHNTDGSISDIEVVLSTAIYTSAVTKKTGTWKLDSIARYFSKTPTLTLESKTENQFNFKWSTSETCSAITAQYKQVGAKDYSSLNPTVASAGATSGTFQLTNLNVNTAYEIYITATRKDSTLKSDSTKQTQSTYAYPYIAHVSIADLPIGTPQTLTLSNDLKKETTVSMYYQNDDDSLILLDSKKTTAEEPTVIELNPETSILYQQIPNTTSGKCVYIASCADNLEGTRALGNFTFKILGTEKPVLNTKENTQELIHPPLIWDINADVTSVTGQTNANGWLVQSLSQLRLDIYKDLAIPTHYAAAIRRYDVTIDGVLQTFLVSDYADKEKIEVFLDPINFNGEKVITIKAIDTRGLSAETEAVAIYKNYQSPSIAVTGGRRNNWGTTVDLTVSYMASQVETTNGIKVTWSGNGDSEYIAGANEWEQNEIIATKTISVQNVDNDIACPFTVEIKDKFGRKASASVLVPVGHPAMFVDVEQAGVGINCMPHGQGLYVQGETEIDGEITITGATRINNQTEIYGPLIANDYVISASHRNQIFKRGTETRSGWFYNGGE